MGHLSSYTKEELAVQPEGCGKTVSGFTKPCGWLQPDMEAILCPDCRKLFRENRQQLHAKD